MHISKIIHIYLIRGRRDILCRTENLYDQPTKARGRTMLIISVILVFECMTPSLTLIGGPVFSAAEHARVAEMGETNQTLPTHQHPQPHTPVITSKNS